MTWLDWAVLVVCGGGPMFVLFVVVPVIAYRNEQRDTRERIWAGELPVQPGFRYAERQPARRSLQVRKHLYARR